VIKGEVKMQNDILHMLKKRKIAGIVSSAELDLSQLELNRNIQKLNDEQIRVSELRAMLGKITGLTPEKFNLLTLAPLNLDGFINEFDSALNNESNKDKLNNLGIYNRIDLRIALAQYALAESKLKLQIAEQYPDITFSPAYLYDYGASKWILGLSTLIPSTRKNQALINEAKKISDIEVLSIEKLQTSILNDISKLTNNYETNRALVKKGIEDNRSIKDIENGLDKKFGDGEIDRLEFTKEKLKNMQFKQKLYENKVALIQSGFDFESILQYPIIKQTQVMTNEK
jgi:outer membrane protein TolC